MAFPSCLVSAERFKSGRRRVFWDRIRGPLPIAVTLIGTSLGFGFAPLLPGTMGTVVGVPIHYFTYDWPIAIRLVLWAALFIAGTWAAAHFDALMETADNQNLVMDETVGFGVTAWTAGGHVSTIIVAFVVFRILDMVKPPPVRQVDQFSKNRAKHSKWWGGFGVMADDLVAALMGLALIVVLQSFRVLP